jgi:hypothetical protein
MNLKEFTPEERECISRHIRTKIREGWPRDRAIAAAIRICTNGKKSRKSEDERTRVELSAADPAAVCGHLWFHGTDKQRSAFGPTEGRGRDERPPKKWWDN